METEDGHVADSALSAAKLAPAIEIVDLTDDNEEPPHATAENEDSNSDSPWESDSFYEDYLAANNAEEDDDGPPDPDLCTPEEAANYRRLLKIVGIDQFIIRTLEQGVPAKKICSAFFKPQRGLMDEAPDEAWYPLLGKLMERFMFTRQKIPQYNTLDDAVSLLQKSKNIVVITGAGISTSLGIPDFRSKNTGFYAQLAPLGLSDPQEVFDLQTFQHDPSLFYSIAKGILPSTKKFSPTHAFIRLIQDKDKLLTNYTQNIDNLEEAAGIVPDRLIQCHGSFARATCLDCGYNVRGEEIFDDLKAGRVARCKECAKRIQQMKPLGMKRKRSVNGLNSKKKRQEFEDSSDEDDDYTIHEPGVMKPDIIFFGEPLSQSFHDRFRRQDRLQVDLVIVLGTKLTVAPVGDIPGSFPPHVPQIFVSREPCNHINFDIELLGDCDVVVEELCKRAGWDLQHEMFTEGQTVSVKPLEEDGEESKYRWVLKSDMKGRECEGNPTAGVAFEAASQHGKVDEGALHGDVEKKAKLNGENNSSGIRIG